MHLTRAHAQCLPGVAVCAILVLLILPAGCGGGGGGTAPVIITENLSPFFQGVESVVTAGGPRILATWDPATDDNDFPDQIRYRIFLSDTSDGFDFANPVVTTTAGATRWQLTSGNSPLIGVGKEVFVAVRAMDTEGKEDLNAVECAITCVDPSRIAYVVPGTGEGGTVGDPTDPFTSIDAAGVALGSGAGAVVIAGGVYNELVAVDGPGAGSIGFYGSFDRNTFVAGASPEAMLDRNDPDLRPTILDGTGINPDGEGEMGHFSVHNDGRRTYVAHFTFRDEDDGQALFGGWSVNLVLSGSRFTDPDVTQNYLEYAILIAEENTDVDRPSFDLVGGDFEAFGPTGGVLVGVYAPIARLRVSCCNVSDTDYFLNADPWIPSGADFDFRFESNWIARIDGSAYEITPRPISEGQPGNSDLRILGNRLSGIENDMYIHEFASHGANGTATLLVERNFIGPTDGEALEICFLEEPYYSGPIPTHIEPAQVDVTIRENDFSNVYYDGVHIDELRPGEGTKVNFVIDDNSFIGIDENVIYLSDHYGYYYNYLDFSQDGAEVSAKITDVVALGAYGGVYWWTNNYRGGSNTVEVKDSIFEGMTDDYGIGIWPEDFATEETDLPDVSRTTVRVTGNLVTMGYDYEPIEVYMDVSGQPSVLDVSRNGIIGSYTAIDLEVEFLDAGSVVSQDGGMRGALDLFVDGNVVENAYYYEGIYIDFGGEGAADVFMRVANNRVRSPEEGFYLYSSNDNLRGYLMLYGNSFAGIYDDDATYIRLVEGEWTVLAARNVVIGGGIGGDDGLNFSIDSDIRGADVIARNNVVAHQGEGIEFDDDFIAGIVENNTVAFTGSEEEDCPIGADGGGGVHAPLCVTNCVSYGNMMFDLGYEIIASYTCFDAPASSEGYGCVMVSDPVFQRHDTIDNVNDWFQLSPASPAVDAGNPDPDLNDPDGTRNDLGAFGGPGAGVVGFSGDPTDPIPLLIVGLDPLVDLYAGARLISGAEPVTVVFSDPIDAATISPGTLAFEVNGVLFGGLYTVHGREVTFAPAAAWTPGADVRMVATTAIRTTDGRPLDFRHVRWFAIAPPVITPETEPNNSIEDADVLGPEKTFVVVGEAGYGDSDYFRLTGTAGARLQASLFGYRIGSGDFGLRLRSIDGTVLFENMYALSEGDPFIDYVLPYDGLFFIEVYAEGEFDESPYELEIWRFVR